MCRSGRLAKSATWSTVCADPLILLPRKKMECILSPLYLSFFSPLSTRRSVALNDDLSLPQNFSPLPFFLKFLKFCHSHFSLICFSFFLSLCVFALLFSFSTVLSGSGFNRTVCGSKWTEKISNLTWLASGRIAAACCDAGSFLTNPFSSPSLCSLCPTGQFGSSVSSVQPSCTECPTGRSNVPGSTNCESCPAGRILVTAAPLNCSICSAGKYQNRSHLDVTTTCHACPAGRYIEDGQDDTKHDSIIDCKRCPIGYEFEDQTECQICTFSQYQDQTDIDGVKCKKCAANEFITDDREIAEAHLSKVGCLTCTSGKFSKSGARFCEACDVGKERVDSSCVACIAGQYSKFSDGSFTCQNCLAGFYQAELGKPFCLPCIPVRVFFLKCNLF